MTTVEQLVEHVRTCVTCAEKNPTGTPYSKLVLCAGGKTIKDAADNQEFWKIIRGLLWISVLMFGGSTLVGMKLGAEVGIGVFLLTWSLRFEVNP